MSLFSATDGNRTAQPENDPTNGIPDESGELRMRLGAISTAINSAAINSRFLNWYLRQVLP
jgi:hypothetical protein